MNRVAGRLLRSPEGVAGLCLLVLLAAMALAAPLLFPGDPLQYSGLVAGVLLLGALWLARRRIVLRHVARNALLPLVTMLGLQAAAMLGGSVVVESVFAIPGFGRLAHEAVSGRDAPLLTGIIIVSAVLVIVVNLLVDIAYAALDPRVGSGEASS